MPAHIACPFCTLPATRIVQSHPLAVLIDDAHPVSPGHMLAIPRRHVGSFFDLKATEREAIFDLIDQARERLVRTLQPAGYNIGVNDGPAAGQTVPHLHVHLIPRFPGDSPDPRGGVRWLFPDRADYWSARDRGPD